MFSPRGRCSVFRSCLLAFPLVARGLASQECCPVSGHRALLGHVYGSAAHKRSRSRSPSWLSGSRTDRVGSALDSYTCPRLSPLLSLPRESTAALTPVLALSLSNPGVEPGHVQAEAVLNLLLGFGLDCRCCVCRLVWGLSGWGGVSREPLHSRAVSLSTFLVRRRDSRRTCPWGAVGTTGGH